MIFWERISWLVLMVGLVTLSGDFCESAILYALYVPEAMASNAHYYLCGNDVRLIAEEGCSGNGREWRPRLNVRNAVSIRGYFLSPRQEENGDIFPATLALRWSSSSAGKFLFRRRQLHQSFRGSLKIQEPTARGKERS